MQPQSSAGLAVPARVHCSFGLCDQPAVRTVTSPTAIGHRVAASCGPHARRQAPLDRELAARFDRARQELVGGQAKLDAERRELDRAIADADRVDGSLTRLLERGVERYSDEPHMALTRLGRDLLARWRAEVALFGREVTAS